MADYTNLEKVRLEKVAKLKEVGVDPYPRRVERTHSIQEALDLFLAGEENTDPVDVQVILAGRIRSVRPMGKVIFAHIEDGTAKIQFFFRANDLGEDKLTFFNDHFDLGDFIQGSGKVFRTRTGEISL